MITPLTFPRLTRGRQPLKVLAVSSVILSTCLALTGPSYAQPRPYAASGGVQVQSSAPMRSQVLNLPRGRSAIVDLPADASDVFVSNPAVADAVLRTPRRIFVLGVAPGESDAIFFDRMGNQILNLQIRVDAPTDQLSATVSRLFPTARVEVQSLNGKVILSGMAENAAQADQIFRLAQSFVAGPDDVLNLISIAGKDQVTLKVQIIEVNRTSLKQLGLAAETTYNFGTQSYSFGRPNSYGVNGNAYGGQGLCYNQAGTSLVEGTTTRTDLITTPTGTVENIATRSGAERFGTTTAACLQAFERAGLARTLAEPNLTAVSGESAKFLAGGEFPVPVGQDTQGRITVEFKPFGVGLGFTPVVLSSGRISIQVSTEVSELTNVGALQMNSTLTIPGLQVRRAETTVEMASGSSFMIAGLLQSRYKQTIDSVPGLTALPVLGSLFRSRDFLNEETELVVIVTPYIVSPVHPGQLQTPADNLQPAVDLDTVFMGNVNRVVTDRGGTPAPSAGGYQAPVGYVIE